MQRQSFFFWRDWSRPYKLVFYLLGGLFTVALLVLAVSYLQSPAPAIDFQLYEEAKLQEVPVHQFQKGPFDLTIAGNNYILYERLLGAPLQVPVASAYFFVFALLLSATVFVTVFTTLNQFYYLVGMGVFILFIVGLRLELLLPFGLDNKVLTITSLSAYVLASFYFYYFAKGVTFTKRFLSFLAITTALAGIVFFFSRVPAPFLHLATTGLAAGVIVTVIFAVMVAHEIIAAFIFLVTQGARPSKSLQHFLVISVIYLLNLALAYAVRLHFVDWDILTINFFLLLATSGVLGVWGIRQRQKQYEGILDLEPYGVFGYLAIALVAFASLIWFFQSANDPATDTIGKIVIYSHLGYGIIFMLYILSNFIGMLGQNMAVHKVLYNSNNMPYFSYRLGGLITTLAFLFYNSWQEPVQNAIASYHNAAGDLYLHTGNPELARVYYEKSVLYSYANHHGNYALANLEGAKMNTKKEREYYENAGRLRPTERSLLNWSQTVATDQDNLRALISMREALRKMPDSGPLLNSMAHLHLKTGSYDSAFYYFQRASGTNVSDLALTNLAGLEAELKVPFSATKDSSDLLQVRPEYTARQSNALARLNAIQKKGTLTQAIALDTSLNRVSGAWINNWLINQSNQPDTALLASLTELARKPSNENVREALLFTIALSYYNSGEVFKAFRLLEEVTIASQDQRGKYNNILAMWCLEQNEPERALGYLDYALKQDFTPANLTHAVALTEAGQLGLAYAAWDSLLNKSDTLAIALAVRMKNLLSLPADQMFLMSDEDKYALLRYRTSIQDSARFEEVLSTITSPDFQARSILDRSRLLLTRGYLKEAIATFKAINGLQLTNKKIFEEISILELLLLAEAGDLAALEQRMKAAEFLDSYRSQKIYLEAILAEAKGDTLTAARLFKWVGTSNPFFEEGLIAAANYFRKHPSGNDMFPYQILVEGVQNHPGSIKVRRAYTLEAARSGLSTFALNSLEALRTKLTPKEWEILRTEVEAILAARETD